MLRETRQRVKTAGQTKSDLMKNNRGHIVSETANEEELHTKWSRKMDQSPIQARKNLNIKMSLMIKNGNTKLKNMFEGNFNVI